MILNCKTSVKENNRIICDRHCQEFIFENAPIINTCSSLLEDIEFVDYCLVWVVQERGNQNVSFVRRSKNVRERTRLVQWENVDGKLNFHRDRRAGKSDQKFC